MMELDSLDKILEAVGNCKKCKFCEFRDKTVFAEGKSDAKIMLIGLNPGKEENSKGRLFIGPSGNLLNELLQLANLSREVIYITNLIKCYAPTYSIGQAEIAACSLYLNAQIEAVRPKIIIPLGSLTTQYIFEKYNFPKNRISEIHGKIFHVATYDIFDSSGVSKGLRIIPMFHPAAALRNPELLESIKKDWQSLNFEG